MKCLVIGHCARFLGAHVVRELLEGDHEVAVFDTEELQEEFSGKVTFFEGEKEHLKDRAPMFEEFAPEVVIHLTCHTEEEANDLISVFDGKALQFILISSTNVYRANARFQQTEPGDPDDVPVIEGAPLRGKPLVLEVDEEHDKLKVEQAIAESKTPTTILRLAPLYGPGDYKRRFYPQMVRMIDDRPFIIIPTSQFQWKWTHCHVGNAAHAIVLAATNLSKNKRLFNVGEQTTPTIRRRIENIATLYDWEGMVVPIADEALPDYMRVQGNFKQNLLFDTSSIRKELGFKEKVDYYEGLAESVEWYAEHPPPGMKGRKYNYEAEDALADAVRTAYDRLTREAEEGLEKKAEAESANSG